ncbi:hypothetical protein [Streptomyces sp. KR55]|uniref:hypothetical protein n=1 Tax=Streptomyces sp. KR55 TaxID=3457425 RepID=UPI003FD1FABF
MPSLPRLCGPVCPAREEVNARIRLLMEQPPNRERAAAYEQLLRQWAEACAPCQPCALAA